MPQMMPLNWLMLMLFFSLIYYIIFTNIYFNHSFSQSSTNLSSISPLKLNWMW
uniref:ATP synthase F0 subunit 8 n=3 Tax=Cheumatopsyche TaxID=177865 RepID=A0A3G1ND79_9NEOP|nr:ATP synthase F0 subunit 8 [Cheumatopsyche speciosa]YP_009459924.1 ATP synthase F0 subunit 8 [Cheumatopsyche campyla]YP_009459937.1 ATP synthase F0 subunit 8 [Cheumatopsyche analis]AUT18163.1 ATP synthase F0 subunit 8 [Cheumatopsyche speciosa]AUT18189.1 ATP synthase F0 subunit 8 [Cheumatopsyche campyla]AUT18202.1 ATP synthase F0 subunit 8 [Cheumatopsyche analis]